MDSSQRTMLAEHATELRLTHPPMPGLAAAIEQALHERQQLKEVAEYALHLRMYGERAPGGDETWRKWDSMAQTVLRASDERSGT